MRKAKKFDQKAGIRRLARERVGEPPAPKIIVPKAKRKPKHKKSASAEDE